MYCRVCGKEMKVRENAFVKHMYDSIVTEVPMDFKGKNIPIYECEECTHKQIEYLFAKEYYQEHDSHTEGSAQYFGMLKKHKFFIDKLKHYKNGGSLLEIGCGNGEFLREAENCFTQLTGVDPSNACRRENTEKITYIHGYFDEKLQLAHQYDFIVSFQVFEHITEINIIMGKIKNVLVDDGVVLINVPNGQKIFQEALYHQLMLQHVNYFTPYSIACMIKKHGFELLSIEADDDTWELNVYFKKSGKQQLMEEAEKRIANQIIDKMKNENNIIIWGGGGKAPAYCKGIKKHIDIGHIVDSDIHKFGKFIAGMTLPIEPPDENLIQTAGAILILASSYNNEIIHTLRNKYNFRGIICYIENNEVKVEL